MTKRINGNRSLIPTEPMDRRRFLRRSALMAGGAVTASTIGTTALRAEELKINPQNLPPNVPEWTATTGYGVVTNPYGMPSAFEKHVVRRNVEWLTAETVSSVSFTPLADLQGIITPSGVFFERHHAGVAEVNPHEHRLIIHGLVKRPLILTMDELMRFPTTSRIHFLECPANGGMEWRGAQMRALQFTHGMVGCAEWTGVMLSTLLDEVGVKPEGKWLLVEGADNAAMTRSIPIEKALDDVMVVWGMNGEMLRPEQGYPLRLIVPGWEGNVNIKWLRRIKVGDQPWHHREETSKYTDLMPDGRARRFTWVMEAKSVITSPCPERPMTHGPGFHEIKGLAWSGSGRITRVDVSFDGGNSWVAAELQEPVLSKALTRFRLPWQWDGKPAMLQSRAVDETGYVQPTLAQLRAVRGVNSIYHNNSIQTWLVQPSGEVENVQIA